jgi:predicted ArsR family transcriptional regulator
MTDRRPISGSLQDTDAASPAAVVDDLGAVSLLGDPNRRRLYDVVVAHGEIGRDRAADEIGISRELAAFHLDRLVRGGLLETSYRRLTGRSGPGAGRPAKLYRRSSRDHSVTLPPRRYEVLAEAFAEGVAQLADDVGSEIVTRAMAEPARALGRRTGVAARVDAGARAGRERVMTAIAALLTRAGYEPRMNPEASRTDLCNCPYKALSDAHRDLTCGVNLAWAEGLVEGVAMDGLGVEFGPTPGRCCVTLVAAE